MTEKRVLMEYKLNPKGGQMEALSRGFHLMLINACLVEVCRIPDDAFLYLCSSGKDRAKIAISSNKIRFVRKTNAIYFRT